MQSPTHSRRPRSRRQDSILLFTTLVAYYFCIEFAYKNFMLTRWGEDFLETSWGLFPEKAPLKLLLPLLFLTLAIFALSFRKRASDFFHLICLVTPLIPMVVIQQYKGVGENYVIMCLLAFLTSFFVSKLPITAPFIRLKYQIFTNRNYVFFIVLLGVLLVGIVVLQGGLAYINFNFDDVYTYRRAASDLRGTLVNYVLLNFVGVLLPLATALSFKNKTYAMLIILVFVNIMIFGLTSNKSYLFAALSSFGLYFILGLRNSAAIFVTLMGFICLALSVSYLVLPQTDYLGTLFVRRFFFVPAYVNFQYWEFFSQNPFAFWSDSKLSLGMIQPVYGVSTPRVVADYFSQVNFTFRVEGFSNSNTAWFGSGYGNAGYYGLFFYAIISGFVTKYGNILAGIIGTRTAVAGLGFYFFTIFFTSTDLPAALLSYGFFALIFSMMVWKSGRTHDEK